MTDKPTDGAHTIHASKGGGAGKWLIGAVAAAVIVGGGYLAWKTYAPEQSAEVAANDQYAEDGAYRAGSPDDDRLADNPTPADEASGAPAAVSSERRAQQRRAAASADVPEQTIGVTPASVTTEESAVDDGDDIVVTAPPRPVWARTPNAQRLNALYPQTALENGREGEARLQCTVLDGGALDCARVEETSNNFGYAAMRVARTLRHAPTRADGSNAVGTPVNLRVVFRLEEEDRARFASH